MPENEFLIQLLSYTPRDLATVTVTHTAIGCLSVIHCPSMGLEARYLPAGDTREGVGCLNTHSLVTSHNVIAM
jgi:hypothetical protein